MIIYLDFDGTVVEHEYPWIGRCNFGCFEIIKKLQDSGHKIILNTYRVETNNGTLQEAQHLLNEQSYMFFKDRETEIKPITEHTNCKFQPERWDWDLMKKHEIMYIDDWAHDIPLKKSGFGNGNMVDWNELDKQFIEHGVYNG